MKRTVQSAVLAGMMAFGLAACNTPSNTDAMSGSSNAGSTVGSPAESTVTAGENTSGQVPAAGKGQSWSAGASGATGVNSASGTMSNDGVQSDGTRK